MEDASLHEKYRLVVTLGRVNYVLRYLVSLLLTFSWTPGLFQSSWTILEIPIVLPEVCILCSVPASQCTYWPRPRVLDTAQSVPALNPK